MGWTPFPGEVQISGEATPPSNSHSPLPQAPCNLRSNVIYWDKGCLSLVQVHDSLRGEGCVNTGNVYLSMSHFLKVDYLTLKECRGSSESILRKSWGSQLCHFQRSRGHEVGVGWGLGVQETIQCRVSMPLGSSLREPILVWAASPWIWKQGHFLFSVPLPMLPSPLFKKKISFFFQMWQNCHWCHKTWFSGFPDTTLSDDIPPCFSYAMVRDLLWLCYSYTCRHSTSLLKTGDH